MAAWAKVRSNDSVHLNEALGVPNGLEPSHSPLPLTRRFMRVLSPIVQVPVLSMSNAGDDDPFSRPVAAQLVRNDHERFATSGPQQLTKESDRSKPNPLWLNENIKHDAVLINRSPEVVGDAVDLQEDLIQMPFIARASRPSGYCLPNLSHHHHSAYGHHFFHTAKAHTETEIVPNAFRNDFPRRPMATVQAVRHSSSIASHRIRSNVTMPSTPPLSPLLGSLPIRNGGIPRRRAINFQIDNHLFKFGAIGLAHLVFDKRLWALIPHFVVQD